MRKLGIVVIHPTRNHGSRMGQIMEQGPIEKLIPHPAIESFHEAILHRLAWRNVVPFDSMLGTPALDRMEVSSAPLSDTIMPGFTHRSSNTVNSNATRRPDIEVSRITAQL